MTSYGQAVDEVLEWIGIASQNMEYPDTQGVTVAMNLQHGKFCLPIEDDGQVIFGVVLQCPNAEIEVTRRVGDEEIGVFLFLDGNRFGIESRDDRGEPDGGGS